MVSIIITLVRPAVITPTVTRNITVYHHDITTSRKI